MTLCSSWWRLQIKLKNANDIIFFHFMISILWKILSLPANIKSMAKEKAKIDNPFVTTGYAGAFDLYGKRP